MFLHIQSARRRMRSSEPGQEAVLVVWARVRELLDGLGWTGRSAKVALLRMGE